MAPAKAPDVRAAHQTRQPADIQTTPGQAEVHVCKTVGQVGRLANVLEVPDDLSGPPGQMA
eukprot:5009838-Lingulodinium_polyedra.AAC.1